MPFGSKNVLAAACSGETSLPELWKYRASRE